MSDTFILYYSMLCLPIYYQHTYSHTQPKCQSSGFCYCYSCCVCSQCTQHKEMNFSLLHNFMFFFLFKSFVCVIDNSNPVLTKQN